MADAGDATKPASMVTLQLDVDRYIWRYINRSDEYRRKLEAIGKEFDTTVSDTDGETSEGMKQLSLTGDDGERMTAPRSALLQLVDECRQTVSTYTIQGQDAETCDNVADNLSAQDDPDSALVDVDSAAGVIRLTGTKEEINSAFGLLEIYGVPVPEPGKLAAQSAVPVDETPPPSLQLWKEQERDQDEDNIYASQRDDADSPATVVVDAKLWKYLQKSNGQWVAEITDVRDKMGIVISESLTADGAVSLTFTGVDDDVVESTKRMRQLVERCRDVVQTVDVVCPNSDVHKKVLKFLSHVNKLPAYVAVESSERVTATGTSQELDECANKLVKLGASLARDNGGAEDHPSSKGGVDTASDDEPLPNTPWLELAGKGGVAAGQDLEEDERLARQLQEEEDTGGRGHFASTRPPDAGDDGRQYGEIPVPIEDVLWSFAEKRRAQQLQQLREAYMVKISTRPAPQQDFVIIAIEAESALMLECAQDELSQLLENLRASIVVQMLQTGDEQGQGDRQLPPQVGQLFNQLAEGTDAVIEVKNNNITITGPEVMLQPIFLFHVPYN